MEGPAPKEIIQPAEQVTKDLYEKVSGHLNQAGHRVTSQSVNPEDQSPLKGIEGALGDTTHVVGSTFEEMVRGSDTFHVRTTEAKVPRLIAFGRGLKRRFSEKAA